MIGSLQAHRRLIVPVALGLILLPTVIASMVEPQVPAGEQPPAGLWMLVVLAMIIIMFVGQIAMVLLVNGWRGSVGEAIGQAARRAPTLILAAILFGIAGHPDIFADPGGRHGPVDRERAVRH